MTFVFRGLYAPFTFVRIIKCGYWNIDYRKIKKPESIKNYEISDASQF
jgi:hypothetical protein